MPLPMPVDGRPDLEPLSVAIVRLGLTRTKAMRLLAIGELHGECIRGRWYLRTSGAEAKPTLVRTA